MTELFKLLGTIAIDNSEANEALDETSSKGEQSESKLSSAFSKMGSAAVKVGKVVAAGLAAGVAGITALVTKSVQSYADFEQLVGGVETLFGAGGQSLEDYAKSVGKSTDAAKDEYYKLIRAQNSVLRNAEKAYKDAGLSQNEYMETVTSFSAALISSLGGDTQKAAAVADKAIIDMADNANKMGSSMESIQNAYQGFAKQNYTMLDNLKLGYGGTKEEMQRLLKDAQKFSGIKYDISSYADVVEAIHVIQDEMGIAGATADEAASTISGSVGMMKSAWKNLVNDLAAGSGDIDDYISAFVDSVGIVADNVIPVFTHALGSIVYLIQELAPKIIDEVPKLAAQLLPSVIITATSLIQAIVDIIPDLVQAIVNSLPAFIDGFVQIFNGIVQALPTLFESLVASLPTLLPLLINGLVLMIVTLCSSLSQIIQPIIDYLPEIIVSIVTALIQNLPILIEGAVLLVVALVQAIPEILVVLWETITSLASSFVSELFGKIEGWIRELFPKSADTVMGIIKVIEGYFVLFIKNLGVRFSVIATIISKPFKLAWEGIKLAWSNAVAYFQMIWKNIKAVFAIVDSVLSGDFKGAWNGIKKIWGNAVSYFKSIVSNIKKAFSNVAEILISPFKKGKEAIGKIVENIKGFFKGVKLSFPKIKLPHFSIKPKGWDVGDLVKGKIPTLGISWYSKAMNKPMILDKPTIFGYNAATGKLLGGGEAGSEVVSGTNTLMNMIQAAVSEQNTALTYYIQKLIEMLASYFPQILENMDREIVLDTGATVGALAVPMDEALGRLQIRKDRGR